MRPVPVYWKISGESQAPKSQPSAQGSQSERSLNARRKHRLDGLRPLTEGELDRLMRDFVVEFTYNSNAIEGNTLDEDFREAMDDAVSIEQRIAAMEVLYEADIRTTCSVSPIFPGITDVPAIVGRGRGICQLLRLENLNLRGNYKARILEWVHGNRPDLDGLDDAIYRKGDRSYWEGPPYVRNNDTLLRPFGAPPVMVDFFYHEEIKRSAKAKR